MKKISFVFLFLILLLILSLDWFNHSSYKALEISDDCKIGIDLNHNGNISEKEYFSLDKIRTFCSAKDISEIEKSIGKLSLKEKIYLAIKTKEVFQKTFLLSKIRLDNSEMTVNFQDPNVILLRKGVAFAVDENYKQFENFDALKKLKNDAKTKNFVLLNTKSLKYHKLDCPKGATSKQKIYVLFEELPQKAKPCGYCYNSVSNNIAAQKLPTNKIEEFSDSIGNVKIFQTMGVGTLKPSSKCSTAMCRSLLKEINSSKTSIDMAIYDFLNQPELLKALQNAKSRGVKIRVVIDNKNYKENVYAKNAVNSFAAVVYDDSFNKKEAFRLMHNKFMIFDGQKVWTGTANVTDTCLSGFNSNITLIINSKQVAEIFEKEFENFAKGKFHSAKPKTEIKTIKVGQTSITPYFSPKDKVISSQVIPELKKAQKYIYIPSFITTHKDFSTELINAKKRGVDVRLITDATSARNKYSVHTLLRKNGIPVKTENFAGKMHAKAVIIDDRIAFVGSMNLTKSGNVYNDENCLKIENRQLVIDLKKGFLKIWAAIPDKFLKFDPSAESLDSVGSCFDGIDNDFDGFVDGADSGCKIKSAKNK